MKEHHDLADAAVKISAEQAQDKANTKKDASNKFKAKIQEEEVK